MTKHFRSANISLTAANRMEQRHHLFPDDCEKSVESAQLIKARVRMRLNQSDSTVPKRIRFSSDEAVEGRFLADAPGKPLEGRGDVRNDPIKWGVLNPVSHSNLSVFALSHLDVRFQSLYVSLLLEFS